MTAFPHYFQEPVAAMICEASNRVFQEQNAWLEDVLAGLLVAGCRPDEIEVRRFQDDPLRVVVAVRGEEKYEHRINFKGVQL